MKTMNDKSKTGGGRAKARSTDRRLDILKEAITLIGERGYQGFSIQELAQRCDLSGAGLLHHFKSKSAILIAVLEERERQYGKIFEDVTGLVVQSPDKFDKAAQYIKPLLMTVIRREQESPHLVRLVVTLQAEALNPAHPAHDYFRRYEAEAIDSFSAMLSGRVLDPVMTSRQLCAILFGLEMQWLRTEGDFDLPLAWEAAIDAILPDLETRSPA